MSNFNDFSADFTGESMPISNIGNNIDYQNLPTLIPNNLHSYTELDETMYLELVDWVGKYGIDQRILGDSAIEAIEIRGEFESMPEAIITLSRLFDLKVVSDHLTKLPKQFGELVQLGHLELQTFELSELPASFVNMAGLESLKVYSNKLQQLPDRFYRLFNLQNLRTCIHK